MFTEGLTVSSPVTFENMSVFPIRGAELHPDASFISLDEALVHKLLVVHETGSVGELVVENVSSSFEVFIQAGDIVKGGLQDRALAYDVIVPARSGRVPVGAFCVEQARWRQRGDEDVAQFMRSEHRVHSAPLVSAMRKKSQGEVWEEVWVAQARLSERLGKDVRSLDSETSLQLSLEDEEVEKRARPYVDTLMHTITSEIDSNSERALENAIGYAVAINGKLVSAELYSSKALFSRLWPKMLKTNAVAAVSEFDEKAKFASATIDDVRTYLNDAKDARVSEYQVRPRVRVLVRETPRTVCEETLDEGRGGDWIHRSWMISDSDNGSVNSRGRTARRPRV
jgi:hypothetical protein